MTLALRIVEGYLPGRKMWRVGRGLLGLAGVVACSLGGCSGKPRDFGGQAGASGDDGTSVAGNSGAGTSTVGGSGAQGGASAQAGTEASESGAGGAPLTDCGDTQSSPDNCGECGNACDAEQACKLGECVALPNHCKDSETNEDEVDLNCGGSCEKCVEGQTCKASDGCTTAFCDKNGLCAVPSCEDGAQNGRETGVDCGGTTCRDLNLRCNDAAGCEEDADCKSLFCNGGKCAAPTCTDEVQNQGETFIDCGGPVCRLNVSPLGTCPNGKGCAVDGDCTSQFCKDEVCTKPSCTDGVKNQDETGKDCGGPTCRAEANGKCADGGGCVGANDCQSGFCSTGKVCSPAGCGNGAKDLNETDVDCGGDDCRATKPCALGLTCNIHADCASGSCKSSKCIAATCGDGIKNQDETDLDCGGAACSSVGKTCANNLSCVKNSDCTDGFCLNGKCSNACKGKPPTLGCPCTPEARLACAGAAQKLRLVCTSGSWVSNNACSSGDNCTQADGVCRPIVSACAGKTEGFTYCEQTDVLRSCGEDLVSASSTTCPGVCMAGACVAAKCGDGKQQSGEECDDGNTIAGDGCEPATSTAPCKKSKVLKISAGSQYMCALLLGGSVRCWGKNDVGQLGQGNVDFLGDRHPFEVPVLNLGGVATDVAAGVEHACALLSDKSVRCWGGNSSGQLGLGDVTPHGDKTPAQLGAVSLGAGVTALAAGGYFSCALLTDGSVRCWGSNDSGELGLATFTSPSSTKKPSELGSVALGAAASEIYAGTASACAKVGSGSLRCWGYNGDGELGLGHTNSIGDDEAPFPDVTNGAGAVPMAGNRAFSSVALSSAHTCVRLSDGSLQCWGYNPFGQLGRLGTQNIGDDESATAGIATTGNAQISLVRVGSSHTCALFSGVGVKCWGLNSSGELGDGTTAAKGSTAGTLPSVLPAIGLGASAKATDLYLGVSTSCALLDTGDVKCWGLNDAGQLGLGKVSSGTKKWVGGTSDETPDKLTALRLFK